MYTHCCNIPSEAVFTDLLKLFEKQGYSHTLHNYYPVLVVCEDEKRLYGDCRLNAVFGKKLSLEEMYNFAKTPQKQQIMVGEYKVEFGQERVTIGCQSFTNETIRELQRRIKNPIKSEQGIQVISDHKKRFVRLEGSNYDYNILSFENLNKIVDNLVE